MERATFGPSATDSRRYTYQESASGAAPVMQEEESPMAGKTSQEDVTWYNHEMMRFLRRQLEKAERVETPSDAEQCALDALNFHIGQGRRLLRKHCDGFDICDFYSPDYARCGIEHICREMGGILGDWRMRRDCNLEEEVPLECQSNDEEDLCKVLEYVLWGKNSGIRASLLDQYRSVKDALKARLDQLGVVAFKECEFRPLEKRGHGASGIVFAADWLGKARKVAIKQPRTSIGMVDLALRIKEGALQATLQHPNIVQLYGYTASGWLVTELADMNLCDLYRQQNLGWQTKWTYAKQVAAGLHFVHSKKHVHCDVKPENVLVFGSGMGASVKLADFGHTFETAGDRRMSVRKGGRTPLYTAPEGGDGAPLDCSSDTFSFGVTMFELVAAKKPYRCRHGADQEVGMSAKKHKGEDPCKVEPKDCPQEMLELMRHCIRPEPQDRPAMKEVVQRLERMPNWMEELPIGAVTTIPPSLRDSSGRKTKAAMMDTRAVAFSLANLVLTIKQHYSAWWADKERGQRLTERADTMNLMLREMGEHWKGKEVPESIAGTLDCVSAELKRVDALCKDLQSKSLLQQMFEAPRVTDKYRDIERNLDYAINVLLLATRLQEDPQLSIQPLVLLQMMAVLMSQTDTLEVNQGIISKLLAHGKQEIDSDKEHLRYNEETMEFLQDQLEKIKEVLSTQRYLELLEEMRGGESLEEEGKERKRWQESTRKFAEHVKLGHLLIIRHRKPFDIMTFYKVFEAREAVEMTCEVLQAFVKDWGFTSVEILKVVPDNSVLRDKHKLHGYLMYVLKNDATYCAFESDLQRQEWLEIKCRAQGWLEMLPVVRHDDLELGDHVYRRVFKGTWNKRVAPVAVKLLRTGHDPAALDLEDLPEFFSAIVALCRINSAHVVKIIGVTETPKILMELGHCDLQKWLEDGQHKGLSTKLGLLLQAAIGLKDVHSHGLVHRAVHTRKFVLFGDEASPKVKICGFPISTVGSYIRDLNAWIAPEIFDGKAYSTASDIYSFGMVLYHVVGGLIPYGRRTPGRILLAAVRAGKLPTLPRDMELPEKLLALMKQCCSREPIDRPKDMQEVCDALKAICNDLKSSL